MMIALRFLSVIQLMTIFPVICYVLRTQFFGTFFKDSYPSKVHVIIYSLLILSLAQLVLYFYYDTLGKLMSFIGAATGLVLIYFIPLIVNIVYYKVKHPKIRQKELNRKLVSHSVLQTSNDSQAVIYSTPGEITQAINGSEHYLPISKKRRNIMKDIAFYVSSFIMLLLGSLPLAVQFYPINFFGVKIK